jgi:hypothetical protein
MRLPGRLALAAAVGGARPRCGPGEDSLPAIRSYSFTDTEQLLNWGFR